MSEDLPRLYLKHTGKLILGLLFPNAHRFHFARLSGGVDPRMQLGVVG